jgi:HAE1 family hydrophobic/amphiphilic exporter-1
MLADFPVKRPIVSMVISILIVIMGIVADITPPVVQVTTSYPGASAQVVADTVASPIEQQVNGVPGMIYMESTSASDGSYTLNVTFEVGTNIDVASVLVQNRVSIALTKLPEEVRRQGVTTNKVSSSIVMVFGLRPADEGARAKYSDLYLSNYLLINVNDRIKRITGVGDTLIRPSKDYGMRIWIDPDQLKARSLTAVDVVRSLQEQNVQVAAGVIGQPPAPAGLGFQYSVTTLGRLEHPEQFADVIVRADGNRVVRLRDVARVELGARAYDTLGRIDGVPSALMVVYQSPDDSSFGLVALIALMIPSALSWPTFFAQNQCPRKPVALVSS